jgi:hypothetical protein
MKTYLDHDGYLMNRRNGVCLFVNGGATEKDLFPDAKVE